MSKKMLFGFAVLMLGAFILVGCGQQTPTINTSNPQPQGLKLKGVVRTTTLNSTVGGPISGAVVVLSGDSANRTTSTNAQGEYLFENVPDGSYILIVTAEGHTRITTAAIAIKPSTNIPADNTITVTDVQLGSLPILIGLTPVPNSVIGNRPTFVATFDEAMDTTTVVPALTATGVRTLVVSGTTVPLAITWDTANKVMTAVAQADLISNEAYNFTVNTGARDTAGYAISAAPQQALALSNNFRVSTGGVPGAPSNLVAGYNSTPFTNEATGVDFVALMNGAASLNLNWLPSTGNVTGYSIYLADSATGVYHLYATTMPTVNFINIPMSAGGDGILPTLFGVSTIDPLGTANYPMINKPLYVKVVAYNGDGESVAASISLIDLVGPRLSATAFRQAGWPTTVILDNCYPLPGITDTSTAYVAFREPVDKTSAENIANYSVAGGTIVSATLMTNSSTALTAFAANAYSVVKIKVDIVLTGAQAITSKLGGVKDLSGNSYILDTTATP